MILVSALLLSAQCSSNNEGAPVSSSVPWPREPLLELRFVKPAYLETDVPSTSSVALDVETHWYHNDENPRLHAQKEVVIESYPGRKPVAGTWLVSNSLQRYIIFEPAAPLAAGDYLIRVPNAGPDIVVWPRLFNLFRVGSLLRVAEIRLGGDKPSAPYDLLRLQVVYSERAPEGLAASVEVNQLVGAAWTTLAATRVATTPHTELRLAQPLDPTKLLRLTISAPGLDGQFSGKADSGPLTVEFLPSEHQHGPGQVQYFVPLSLP